MVQQRVVIGETTKAVPINDAPFVVGERRNGAGKTRLLSGKNASSSQKPRGGYYTPAPIATFLADWGIRDGDARVLEPSAGDGALIEPMLARLGPGGCIIAVELDPLEARKAAARSLDHVSIIEGDFSAWYLSRGVDGAFDAAVGNPPFVRYGDFPELYREPAFKLMRDEGLHPTKLTNMWLPFVVGCTRALRQGGRLALVLPAELLQVTYAGELREYLVRKYSHLTVVTFRRLVFAGIQQEVVLLLGIRRDDSAARMSFVEIDDMGGLATTRIQDAQPIEADLHHGRKKWTQYYLTPVELGLIRELERSDAFGRLGHYARVDVGVVTGFNDFFVLTEEEAEAHGVRDRCIPLAGRSVHIPGLVLREEEWSAAAARAVKYCSCNWARQHERTYPLAPSNT